MSDAADRAEAYEQADRERALHAVLASSDHSEPQLIHGSTVVCRECLNPIGSARIAALPGVTRCLQCQRAVEREESIYGI